MSSDLKKPRCLIVGSGPSGLLLAHKLLDSGKWDVTVQDARADPREQDAESTRQWSLGLNIRGRTAVQSVDGLWDALLKVGLESEKFFLHFGGPLRWQIRQKTPGSKPTLLLNRTRLCCAMLDEIERKHPHSEYFSALWDTEFSSETAAIDEKTGVVDGHDTPFDVIVGADGVRSAVRSAASFACDLNSLPERFRVLHQVMPPRLGDIAIDAIHVCIQKESSEEAALAKGAGLFIIPAKDGKMCGLVSWKNDNERPPFVKEGASAEAMRDAMHARFPQLGDGLTLEACQRFLDEGRDGRAGVVRCDTYVKGRVALMGDAAHSTGGTLGQGANSALMDAADLADRLVEAAGITDGDAAAKAVQGALEAYNESRVPEGQALAELLGVLRPERETAAPEPASAQERGGGGGPTALIKSAARSVVRQVMGRVDPGNRKYWNSQTLMSQTRMPFVEIANLAKEQGTF